jgi:thymidine phosphorylase
MLPQEIIRRKRDGLLVAESDIRDFVRGMVDGVVSEGQVAAFGMAVFFRGMTMDESVALTRAMTESGTTLAWDVNGPVLDKHSTGGVGDLVSLALGPLVAACGGYVPMISGRGLGHTGGTLDKLESIPGYVATPDEALFRKTVAEAGCAIIGQTSDLAPADRMFYAVRDVTATVESVPLITASILSKKLAAGLGGLVMDVKTGSGAFMPTREKSRELAKSIRAVARGAGLPCEALITDMNQPLAPCAGNGVEVAETVRFLTGNRDPRLEAVVLALGVRMLRLGGLADSDDGAEVMLGQALDTGRAAERFGRMVALLGGPTDLMENPERYLPQAPVRMPVTAERAGVVTEMDARALGLAVVELGGGRTRPSDKVDHAVGLSAVVRIGDRVEAGEPLCLIHAADKAQAESAKAAVQGAVRVAEECDVPQSGPVLERV